MPTHRRYASTTSIEERLNYQPQRIQVLQNRAAKITEQLKEEIQTLSEQQQGVLAQLNKKSQELEKLAKIFTKTAHNVKVKSSVASILAKAFIFLFLGAVIAAGLYFAGGLAFIPCISKIGVLIIPAVTPIISGVLAAVWGLVKCCLPSRSKAEPVIPLAEPTEIVNFDLPQEEGRQMRRRKRNKPVAANGFFNQNAPEPSIRPSERSSFRYGQNR